MSNHSLKQRTMRIASVGAIALTVLLAGCSSNGASFPEYSAAVVDTIQAVDDSIEASLSIELEQFQTTSGPQIAVAVINSTGSASIQDYAIDLARTWGVGDAKRDDGVLILIALEDRELRIEVGSGVEGELTDIAAGRIVDNVMLPLLRANDVNGAVVQGARAAMAVWRGEAIPLPTIVEQPAQTSDTTSNSLSSLLSVLLFIFFIGGSIFLSLIARLGQHTTWTSGGSRRGYGGIFIPGGFGGSGGGFGGGGFGGFGGGGGGGFSGGGAGGSW
jgi:uncharacterized protein